MNSTVDVVGSFVISWMARQNTNFKDSTKMQRHCSQLFLLFAYPKLNSTREIEPNGRNPGKALQEDDNQMELCRKAVTALVNLELFNEFLDFFPQCCMITPQLKYVL